MSREQAHSTHRSVQAKHQTHKLEIKITRVKAGGGGGHAGVSPHCLPIQEGASAQCAQLETAEGIVFPQQEEADDGNRGESWGPQLLVGDPGWSVRP